MSNSETLLSGFIGDCYEQAIREFRTGPRQMLADLTSVEPEESDPAAWVISPALAIAFFRRIGVF